MDYVWNSPWWASFVTVTSVWLVTVISPGPDFVATVHTAVSRSRRAGVIVALGISASTTIWAVVSLLGLGLLFQSAGWLYHIAKLLGAIYLIYLGGRMIWSTRASHTTPTIPAAGSTTSNLQAFRRGFLTDLSNPKAAVFFTSLFAVAVPPAAPHWFQATIVLAVVSIAGGWYSIAAYAMGAARVAASYRRAERAISRVTGAILVGLGCRLAADR